MRPWRAVPWLVILALLAPTSWVQAAVGTAFTYQGRLSDAGVPANGSYDVRFILYDADVGGSQMGPIETRTGLTVTNGVFTVTIDFGAVFTGDRRWLELAVRPGGSTGAYAILSPRQELTPAPNALFSAATGDATVQRRTVPPTCPAGQYVQSLAADGTPTCVADANSGGTVTSVGTGAGLTGGPITGSGTVSVASEGIDSGMIAPGAVGLTQIDTAQVQARITGTCPTGRLLTGVNADGSVVCSFARAFRWNTFSTYDHAGGWLAQNDPTLFGGVNPSNWTDNNATAAQISADKEVQRTHFNQKIYPGKNALVYSNTWNFYSSTDGRVVVALLRIRNTTAGAINWTPQFRYTCYGGWGEWASVALNGVNQFSTPSCGAAGIPGSVTMSIPGSRTSTVIFVSTSGPNGGQTRSVLLAFYNDSLQLPAGLELVDDLDTATGGYEQ